MSHTILLLALFCVTATCKTTLVIQNMQVRNTVVYYKLNSMALFNVTTKMPKLGGVFNLTHILSNKTCGFSPLTKVLKCDSKYPNTIRLLDKHGVDGASLTNDSYVKLRMNIGSQKVNDDCWATTQSPLMCTKPKHGEYGWLVTVI